MQFCPCPRCGAPLPVTLASLRGVRCRACGYAGPAAPDIVERLAAAERALHTAGLHARQFDARARAAIVRALHAGVGVTVAIVLGGLPFALLVPLAIAVGVTSDELLASRVLGVLFIAAPAIVYAAVAVVLVRALKRARANLLEGCAAVPPERPGEPAACSLCGATIGAWGTNPIARCSFCGADNVVHPEAMARALARKTAEYGAMTLLLADRSRAIGSAARRAGALTVAAVFGAPLAGWVFGAVLIGAIAIGEKAIEPRPSERLQYAWIDTPLGKCVAKLKHEDDKTLTDFGDNERLTSGTEVLEPRERFSASAMVGQRVRVASGAQGKVRKAYGGPLNIEMLVLEGGEEGEVAGACAASP